MTCSFRTRISARRRDIVAGRVLEQLSVTLTAHSSGSGSSSSNPQTSWGMRPVPASLKFFCAPCMLLRCYPALNCSLEIRRWCMPFRFLPLLAVLLLAFAVDVLGQKKHNLNWKTGASPNVFDTVEKQGNGSQQPSAAERAALRQQREAKLADLSRELDAIIHAA